MLSKRWETHLLTTAMTYVSGYKSSGRSSCDKDHKHPRETWTRAVRNIHQGTLINQMRPVSDPIKRNNFPLFSRPLVRDKSRAKEHLSSVKKDCSLFSRLYISCQTREGDLTRTRRIHHHSRIWANYG